jgi:hypothetical protein
MTLYSELPILFKIQGLMWYDYRCVCVWCVVRVCVVCVPVETLAVIQPGCMADNFKVKLPHIVSICKKMKLMFRYLPIQFTAKLVALTLTDKSNGKLPSLPGTPN